MKHVIMSESWNGSPCIYNVEKGAWELSDNVTVCSQHDATGADLEAAKMVAMDEGAVSVADNARFEVIE